MKIVLTKTGIAANHDKQLKGMERPIKPFLTAEDAENAERAVPFLVLFALKRVEPYKGGIGSFWKNKV
jgi:hypothetical protein